MQIFTFNVKQGEQKNTELQVTEDADAVWCVCSAVRFSFSVTTQSVRSQNTISVILKRALCSLSTLQI